MRRRIMEVKSSAHTSKREEDFLPVLDHSEEPGVINTCDTTAASMLEVQAIILSVDLGPVSRCRPWPCC